MGEQQSGTGTDEHASGLGKYLSPLSVWALSFGCAVGWGSFVMPGTTFLPAAGPVGTVIGIVIGAVVMFIIGMNYHYLMNRYPDAGGALTYTIKAFGYDYGFLSAWFLALVYVAIMWANASALTLITRNLLGSVFQFGFHYQILGYDVYMGEVLLSIGAILLCGCICIFGKRLAVGLQSIFATILLVGIVVCAVIVLVVHGKGNIGISPAFSTNGKLPVAQIFTIVALSPWAFVGFESISNSTTGFRFPVKKSLGIITAALVTGAVAYILLTILAASGTPDGYENWSTYIGALGEMRGLKGLPTFYAVHSVMGEAGVVLLGVATLAAILTGLIGNYIAASRLLYAMSEDGILPEWFGKLNKDASPKNALLFLMLISLLVPFLGRTALGWIVDVNTVGATIAYAYTSAAAFVSAGKEKNRKIQLTGGIGVVMSFIFFLYFMSWSAGAMATESYLILAGWSILGFVYFRYVFKKDEKKRFGKSTIVWIGLLFLIFFTSLMWVKQATDEMTQSVVGNIRDYYEERNTGTDPETVRETEEYLSEQLEHANYLLTRNSMIQMVLIMASLAIMFSIYTTISKREKQMEIEKFEAEESSKAKSTFLSNMSHDIRTPMNAIIGYINLADRDGVDLPGMKEYLAKIKTSSQHLLALINDVLEMSRIESGKMELEPIAVDLKKTLREVYDMFSTQMAEKKIDFRVDTSQIRLGLVYCDKNRLNRVLLNLLSNAYKFTPEGGTVTVLLWQIDSEEKEYGSYELRVADSGIGMTKEFAAKVFEEFEREKTSTVSGIQGTGLGMAITKGIVDLMGGTIEVNTAPDRGTEFIIRVRFRLQEGKETSTESEDGESREKTGTLDFSKMRLLLVEDMDINREIAKEVLEGEFGFTVDEAENGKIAVEKYKASEPGYYDAILMDVQMPVMNGYEAAKEIRELEKGLGTRIPMIATTANAFSEDVSKALEAGMDDHVAKPINFDLLCTTLRQVITENKKASGKAPDGNDAVPLEKDLSGKRVLLAEDVFINIEVMKEILGMRGMITESAENGQIAVDLFSGHEDNYYDVILMDMRMPVMDGVTATKAIRALDREDAKHIPIIAMTGDEYNEEMKQSMQAGMDTYLSKPVEPDVLYETLEKWI